MSASRFGLLLGGLGASALAGTVSAQGVANEPMIRTDAADRIGTHSYVILDNEAQFVPNVGIVIGDEFTLIIDTGMGTRNGRIVLDEARKLGGGPAFYVAATHYHPEHDLGAEAFPDDALLVRWTGQQAEIDQSGTQTIARFSQFSPIVAELLDGVSYRSPDILFSNEIRLDLGGVHVRVIGVGPNHTRGDTVFFVEEDSILYAGDVIMPVFPAASAQDGSIRLWQDNMRTFAGLAPRTIVPAHGRLLEFDSIPLSQSYLEAVGTAGGELASRGADDAAIAGAAEQIVDRFPALQPANGQATGRVTAALRAAVREAQ